MDIVRCNNSPVACAETQNVSYRESAKQVQEFVKGQWSDLPGDLLDTIEGLLSLSIDKIRIRAICMSWCSHLPKMPNLQLRKFPWLLQALENTTEATHALFDPFGNKFYNLYLPEAQGRLFKGSSYGWVATIEDITSTSPADMYLINPLTRARIQLPPRSTFPDVKAYHPERVGEEFTLYYEDDFEDIGSVEYMFHKMYKIILSSPPTSEDCVVVAIYSSCKLAFCKCNSDKWTQIHVPEPYPIGYGDIIFYKEKLYALSPSGRLIVIEDMISHKPKITTIVAELPPSIFLPSPVYLVECFDGELIMFGRHLHFGKYESLTKILETVNFYMYKLGSSGWVEVESLGKDIMFVGCNTSISRSACEYNKGNRIYYTDAREGFAAKAFIFENSDIGFIDNDEETLYELPGLKKERKFIWPPPIWLNPPTQN